MEGTANEDRIKGKNASVVSPARGSSRTAVLCQRSSIAGPRILWSETRDRGGPLRASIFFLYSWGTVGNMFFFSIAPLCLTFYFLCFRITMRYFPLLNTIQGPLTDKGILFLNIIVAPAFIHRNSLSTRAVWDQKKERFQIKHWFFHLGFDNVQGLVKEQE